MRIPSLFHGRYAEVDARCEGLAERLAQGESWAEAVGEARLDTRDAAGLIVLNGPSPLLAREPHFQSYLAHWHIRARLGGAGPAAATEAAVFAQSLETPWGLLGLLAPANVMWVHAGDRHRPLLDACVRDWDLLAGEGERYTSGLPRGQGLWQVPSNLQFVLARLGLAVAELQRPLPAGGLAELAAGLWPA